MMTSEQRAALILQLIEDQAPALFAVRGTVYEGRLERCLRGELTAVARPYGTREEYVVRTWSLDEIDDFGAALAVVEDEDEDPLMEQARAMAKRAQEDDELSLAERLVAQRIPRGENA